MHKPTISLFITFFAAALFCANPAAHAAIAQGSESNTKNGNNALQHNTDGVENCAYGVESMYNNLTGSDNTANGFESLYTNTDGFGNVANGAYSLFNNIANFNTANGYLSMLNNSTGTQNAANGAFALQFNTTGPANTASGFSALRRNTTGDGNTGDGAFALQLNTTGISNTALGGASMSRNTTGVGNTAGGVNSLNRSQTGNYNTAFGFDAYSPVAISSSVFTSGDYNIVVGAFAGENLRTGSNNIYIGNEGIAIESDTIRIGGPVVSNTFVTHGTQTATYIEGIFGAATAGGTPVFIDASGKLGTLPSSERFKDEIKPMDKASESILALQPVTFHYKAQLDKNAVPQFGLVAEEVAKVNPDLVSHDRDGKIYGVRYEAVNAMLLNEFLKEHKQVQEQQKQIDKLTSQLREQASMLQKVSAQVELMKAAPRTVADSQ